MLLRQKGPSVQPEESDSAKPKRRKRHAHHEEEHTAHLAHDESNWLVSYADLMTLLFGFFVLMYSFSKVDKEKFEVVSKDVVKYFGGKLVEQPGSPIGPNELKDLKNFTEVQEVTQGLADKIKSEMDRKGDPSLLEPVDQGDQKTPAETLEYALEVKGDQLVFTLASDLLFPPGGASPSPQAAEVIKKMMAAIGDKRIEQIEVEGHTDADPIQTAQFPSNWELSAARASSIVRLLEEQDLDPEFLRVTGYGSSRPPPSLAADDEDEDELLFKKRSRRVVLNLTVSKKQADLKDNLSQEGITLEAKAGEKQDGSNPDAAALKTAEPSAPLTEEEIKARYEEVQKKMAETNQRLKDAQERQKKIRELEMLSQKTQQMEKKLMELEQKKLETQKNEPAPRQPSQTTPTE